MIAGFDPPVKCIENERHLFEFAGKQAVERQRNEDSEGRIHVLNIFYQFQAAILPVLESRVIGLPQHQRGDHAGRHARFNLM
jgi:hypothetical protein